MQEDIEDGLNELVVRKRKGQIKIDFANIPVAYFLNKVFLRNKNKGRKWVGNAELLSSSQMEDISAEV